MVWITVIFLDFVQMYTNLVSHAKSCGAGRDEDENGRILCVGKVLYGSVYMHGIIY